MAETETERFVRISQKLKELDTKKIRIEEKLKTKKEDLNKLVKEVQEAGYDPKQLKQIIQEKEESIAKSLNSIENELTDIASKLEIMEG